MPLFSFHKKKKVKVSSKDTELIINLEDEFKDYLDKMDVFRLA